MSSLKEILVEGTDDQNVIKNLLSVRGIVKDDRFPDNDAKNQGLPKCTKTARKEKRLLEDEEVIYIVDMGGYEQMTAVSRKQPHRAIYKSIRESRVSHMAIIIDTDTDLRSRWDSITNQLILSGVEPATIPAVPTSTGSLFLSTQPDRNVKVGVWLMPNNVLQGMLEDFLALLVSTPDQKRLWDYVTKVQAKIPVKSRFFSKVHESKAKVHAWLTWQDEPGRPLGQAVTRTYIDPNHPQVDIFVNWLQATLEI